MTHAAEGKEPVDNCLGSRDLDLYRLELTSSASLDCDGERKAKEEEANQRLYAFSAPCRFLVQHSSRSQERSSSPWVAPYIRIWLTVLNTRLRHEAAGRDHEMVVLSKSVICKPRVIL